MARLRRPRKLRVLALVGLALLPACSTLIGLGDLKKADCVSDCSALDTGGSGGSGGSPGASGGGAPGVAGTFIYMAGTSSHGGNATAGSAGNTTSVSGTGGTLGSGGMLGTAGLDAGGAGGETPGSELCPGGPEPAVSWKEHWFEHSEALTRVYYDDCIALYFDPDVPAAAKDWLVPFLDKSWSYSLSAYGKLGTERIYVVVHQGRYSGGHSATYGEASHDNHATIDMGSDSWTQPQYDLPAHLLGFLVDTEGAHTKFGAPKAAHYGNEGFPLIYKYDLYQALGLTTVASQALSDFNGISSSQPYPNTFWFRDWFYPVWKDHGGAQVFASYQNLLQKYYPTDADKWMPTMNYGQYFHFMSGAAGVDLVPLARKAFQWHPDFDDEVAAAKADFPNIKY